MGVRCYTLGHLRHIDPYSQQAEEDQHLQQSTYRHNLIQRDSYMPRRAMALTHKLMIATAAAEIFGKYHQTPAL